MSSFTPAIPDVSPSVRWAQSIDNIFMEVKFATRVDSPACLDLFDQVVEIIENQKLKVQAMCRNDKKLLKYSLEVELYD